jgi:hypothetical protein
MPKPPPRDEEALKAAVSAYAETATELRVQYSTSTAWVSAIIRRLCHSAFSHVDMVIPEVGLLGVSGTDRSIFDPGGVVVRPFTAWPYLRKVEVTIQCEPAIAQAVIKAGLGQYGKPFDKGALWAFIGDKPPLQASRDWQDLGQWFCSEWFIYSCKKGGLFPYELAVTKDRVSPADSVLLINPFLSQADVQKLLEVW